MIALEDLHDATLVNLEVEWASGELRCNFKVSTGDRTLVRLLAHGLTSLSCPWHLPWGRIVSVNHAHAIRSATEIVVVIELQSGDNIQATVSDVALE